MRGDPRADRLSAAREAARAGQRIAISVCDITRAQPRRQTIEALLSEMPGVRPEDITILIATGTHRANTPTELERMLGRELVRRCRVVNHDARDASSARASSARRPPACRVYLNREWLDADVRITTGFVEPHFFAGFSGGPKMVAPGLAGLETVMTLHDAQRIGHPKATWGDHRGQSDPRRCPRDRADGARRSSRWTSRSTAISRSRRPSPARSSPSTARACAYAKDTAMRAVPAPFDVVLTTNSGYPLDQNLYQAVKGMSAAAKIVKPGGTIVCAAECRDGLPNHGSYGAVLASQPSPERLLAMINAPGYSVPDQWQVQVQAQIQMKAQVLVKTTGLGATARSVRRTSSRSTTSRDAVRDALDRAGPRATLCVLPQGPQTIPYLASEN